MNLKQQTQELIIKKNITETSSMESLFPVLMKAIKWGEEIHRAHTKRLPRYFLYLCISCISKHEEGLSET